MRVRPTVVTVDLGAIRHNLEVIRQAAPGQAVCAVVKADAYGHGLVPVARCLAQAGVDWLAVALAEEGLALRQAGVQTPVLVMGSALTGGFGELVEHQLTPVLYRPDQLHDYALAASGNPAPFHLKVDTGMARLGLTLNELPTLLSALKKHPHLILDGVMTHFANADLASRSSNEHQLALFEQALAVLAQVGLTPRIKHIANSAGTLTSTPSHLGLIRPGLLTYGLNPLTQALTLDLKQAMRWTTQAIHIKTISKGTAVSYGGRWTAERDSVIATLPVGYADGYARVMSGKAQVIVRGKRAPVIGTICMDLCMIDVTDVPDITLQDEVVLLGTQDGESVTAHHLARWAGTIPYEIVCGIGPRVPREYRGAA